MSKPKPETENQKRLWQGRFEGAHDDAITFNSAENIELDKKLIYYDVLGSIAHVKMLEKQGIVKKNEADEMAAALRKIIEQHENGEFMLDGKLEDVHTNIENAVTRITVYGKKMHCARSRNDQVLTDMRMYMRDKMLEISKSLVELQNAFVELSKKDGIMAGYTHTRVAQPITVSFWCDSFVQSLYRDLDRFQECFKRINLSPLGAGALAGTGWNIDRAYTAALLGFDGVQENALDVISSRGEAEAELLSCLAIFMAKLSGLAEELIWLSQKGLVLLPDKFCTGSSMMPNKKNPDVLELVRGRTGRAYAGLVGVLSIKKGLMSGYHSDMQEIKPAVMNGTDVSLGCIKIMTALVKQLGFQESEITRELENGFAQATEIADALAKKGVPFRDAHAIVGKLINECENKGITLGKAKPPAQLNGEEWKRIISLKRPRLTVKIATDKRYGDKIDKSIKKTEGSYEKLIFY